MNVSLKTSIAGIEFPGFVFNAAGVKDTTEKELKLLGLSDSSAIVMKTCTIEKRNGNPEPRYINLPMGSLQSMGLPNEGYDFYYKIASVLKIMFGRPIIASIACLKIDECLKMVDIFQSSSADLIEINVSCPNIKGKEPLAYNPGVLQKLLEKIDDNLGRKPIGLKLPPLFHDSEFQKLSELIKQYNISFITCINSVPNTLVINPKTEGVAIKPNEGFGGLGGECIKPIALANVRKFFLLLKESNVDIIAAGGIKSGGDAFEFLLAGASAVEIGTTLEQQGPKCFARINKELAKILRKHNYSSINQVKGNLKSFS